MESKEPLWKNYLSYLFEWHIESRSSEYNPHLYVSLKKGRYQLSTAHAVYSFADLYSNFGDTFQLLDWEAHNIQRVLVLGLGLGSIPLLLEKHLGKDFQCTAIEIDEAVIGLASKYGLPSVTAPIEVICADAKAYLAQASQQFDLICMDVFLDDTVPLYFEGQHFLEDLRDHLTPQGILLYNRLAASKADTDATASFFKNQFLKVFPGGEYLPLSGNWMLVNKEGVFKQQKAGKTTKR
ncbi:MAG: fused MFS/spermidine synthase [Saprospiraceae bacterium]|nr:fused MFS/spermidine synthase [Saprospiraceae bacterium]